MSNAPEMNASALPGLLGRDVSFSGGKRLMLASTPGSSVALLALAYWARGCNVLAVSAAPRIADAFECDIVALSGRALAQSPGDSPPGRKSPAMLFPMIEERDDAYTLGRRFDVASLLSSAKDLRLGSCGHPAPPTHEENDGRKRSAADNSCATPHLVVTSIQSMIQPVPDPCDKDRRPLPVAVGAEMDVDDIAAELEKLGYERVPEVSDRRQYARKGSLVDVWSITEKFPFRIDSDGVAVDSVRLFDPVSQVSVERRKMVAIASAKSVGATVFLHELLPRNTVVIWNDYLASDESSAFMEDAGGAGGKTMGSRKIREQLLGNPDIMQIATGVVPLDGFEQVKSPFAALRNVVPAGLSDPEVMGEMRRAMLDGYRRRAASDGGRVFVMLDTLGTMEHLASEAGAAADGILAMSVAPLSGGFEIPAHRIAVISQSDIYGRSKRAAARMPLATADSASAGARISSIDDIAPGDLVVHVDHGIGIYRGTTEIEFDGHRREVMTVEYAERVKLHVPLSQSHLLSRYIGAGVPVRLHKLGSKRWGAEKDAAERAVQDLASSLLETQAKRSHLTGFAFSHDTPWLHEFEASFPYTETPDQTRCIEDVKRDMESSKPMDRLICGDAGYGKTEVAIRAAFISAMQGKQVAVLVPTTVLAQQHYDVFRERMAAYPVRIAMHSRFATPGQRVAALRGVANGTVDIIIGTHGLLDPSVRFRDLGLVIIDEEQRFGVEHKEHFKAVRQLVDVLTLSATPIPRTLHLGITGLRDLSLLQTPPKERVATETVVAHDDDDVIRTAITREIARGGQVFYLFNRITTMPLMHERLRKLVPQAKIVVGHGQMPTAQIERVVREFAAGEGDVLLCTTIIENGVDIPRVNTIVVDRADRFGIADLYQLRGRVGRGSKKGHAVFLVPRSGILERDAKERLRALRENSGHGAGFQLAMKDLGIRGAGNLLGSAQSGHIAAVGFSLYCQLLRRAVAMVKGASLPKAVETVISLDKLTDEPSVSGNPEFAACLPYSFIDDEPQRIAAYRRLAECVSEEEVSALFAELADRYGHVPPQAERLRQIAVLRVLASSKDIERIDIREGEPRLLSNRTLVRIPRPPQSLADNSVDRQIAYLIRLVRSLPQPR